MAIGWSDLKISSNRRRVEFLDLRLNSNRNCLEELFVSTQRIHCINSISIRYSSYIVSSVDTSWNVKMSVAID